MELEPVVTQYVVDEDIYRRTYMLDGDLIYAEEDDGQVEFSYPPKGDFEHYEKDPRFFEVEETVTEDSFEAMEEFLKPLQAV